MGHLKKNPMDYIYEIIKARHKKHTGHWFVMRTKISDVPILSCTYAWSQRSISYFYQQQEILISHITYTNRILRMSLAVLDGETFHDQTMPASSMTFFLL